jgi:hypothetical protein
MPIGTTNIGMTGIAAELRDPVSSGSPIGLRDNLFSSCQADGYVRSFAGNFHCPTVNGQHYALSIGAPNSSGVNMSLGNWSGYDHVTGYEWELSIDPGDTDYTTEFDLIVDLISTCESETIINEVALTGGTPYTFSGTTTVESFNAGTKSWCDYYWDITIANQNGPKFQITSSTTADDMDGADFINWRRKVDPNGAFLDQDTNGISWPQVLVGGDDGYFNIAGNKRTTVTLYIAKI